LYRFEKLAGQPVEVFLASAEDAKRQAAIGQEEEGNELLPENANADVHPSPSFPLVWFSKLLP
jgi:hypothetical protein